MKDASVLAHKTLKGGWDCISGLLMMVMLSVAFLSSWSYHGPACYLQESKMWLFYLYATAKSKTHVVVSVIFFK